MNETFLENFIHFTSINGYYTLPLLGLIGFITNLMCQCVFFSSKFKEKARFKYVIMKVMVDMYGCLYMIGFQNYLQCLLEPHVMNTNKCVSTGSLFFILIRLCGNRYFSYMFYTWSCLNEVLVNYERYIMVTNKTSVLNKKNSFVFIAIACGLVSFALFIPNIFAYKITLVTNKTSVYFVERTRFGSTSFF